MRANLQSLCGWKCSLPAASHGAGSGLSLQRSCSSAGLATGLSPDDRCGWAMTPMWPGGHMSPAPSRRFCFCPPEELGVGCPFRTRARRHYAANRRSGECSRLSSNACTTPKNTGQKDAEQSHAEHAGKLRHAETCPQLGPSLLGDHERKHAEHECEARHEDRPEAQPTCLHGSLRYSHARLVTLLGKLDDEDGILAR